MAYTFFQTPPAPPAAPLAPAVAGPQAVVAPAATTDLATMQAMLSDLQSQQAGLKAQWKSLQGQLNSMRQDNPARPGVQQEWANVAVNMAQVEGNIAVLQARIAQKEGRPVGTPQVIVNSRRGPDPDMVVGMSLGLAMIIAIPISIAFARRIWRGRPQPLGARVDEIAPRLDRLEQAVDTIAIEIERISEGQRFVTKIMAERPAQGAAQGSAADDAPRALGAGAAEPIRVGERQGVRQSKIY